MINMYFDAVFLGERFCPSLGKALASGGVSSTPASPDPRILRERATTPTPYRETQIPAQPFNGSESHQLQALTINNIRPTDVMDANMTSSSDKH